MNVRRKPYRIWAWAAGVTALVFAVQGCKSPQQQRQKADEAAYQWVAAKQREALGHSEPFTVESPEVTLRRRLVELYGLVSTTPGSAGAGALPKPAHWPETTASGNRVPSAPSIAAAPGRPCALGLDESLEVAAAGSHEYQDRKAVVFQQALSLDFAASRFRNTFEGLLRGEAVSDQGATPRASGVGVGGQLAAGRKLSQGAGLSGHLALDLARLLTPSRASSIGATADVSISVPLLRGAGRQIAEEPLVQADRNLFYALCDFERFRQLFAVRVASEYLAVLRQQAEVGNAEQNRQRLETARARLRRLADAGRISEIQVDQAAQDELRAQTRLISARQAQQARLDGFKLLLGLPPDLSLELDAHELDRLREDFTSGGNAEARGSASKQGQRWADRDETEALRTALEHRLDLRAERGRIEDAQRAVVIAADALRPELTLMGKASFGQSRSPLAAGAPDGRVEWDRGSYRTLLTLDPGFERSAERAAFRGRLLDLDRQVRRYEAAEDRVKLDVRDALRRLQELSQSVLLQSRAVEVAQRRVLSTGRFLEAGRASTRDVLEAQEALLAAQNAYTDELITLRVKEWELGRDLGTLELAAGWWRGKRPGGS